MHVYQNSSAYLHSPVGGVTLQEVGRQPAMSRQDEAAADSLCLEPQTLLGL